MHIKKQSQERREIDIKEWNDEVKSYILPLNGFEQLAFNDYFITFFSDQKSYEERYKAGFNAAKMALVGENNEPLLTAEDEELVKEASIIPFFRMFNATFSGKSEEGVEFETTKKN